jgi:hypothetical protein
MIELWVILEATTTMYTPNHASLNQRKVKK